MQLRDLQREALNASLSRQDSLDNKITYVFEMGSNKTENIFRKISVVLE